jgi:hypothetical protein
VFAVDPVTLTATTDKAFLGALEQWFVNQPEILVLIRYPYAAGSKSFEFFSSPVAFFERLRELPRRAEVTAFRHPQLPLRGVVDAAFVERCIRTIPEGSEFLLVETVRTTYGRASWFHDTDGQTHAELREALEDSRGKAVAVGLYPPWLKDGPDVISAYVPDEDGVARAAVY